MTSGLVTTLRGPTERPPQILVSQHRLQDFGIDADMMLDVDFHAARSGYREGTPAPRSEIHYR
eukprot:COSAG01_NODE_6620_length_3574_cov_9.974676_5_plen_63_part_00